MRRRDDVDPDGALLDPLGGLLAATLIVAWRYTALPEAAVTQLGAVRLATVASVNAVQAVFIAGCAVAASRWTVPRLSSRFGFTCAIASLLMVAYWLVGVPDRLASGSLGLPFAAELALIPTWACASCLVAAATSGARRREAVAAHGLAPMCIVIPALAFDYHQFSVMAAPVRPYLFALLALTLGLAGASGLATRPHRGVRWTGVAGLVAAGLAMSWFTATQYQRLYPEFHFTAWLGTLFCCLRLAALVPWRSTRTRLRGRSRSARAIVALVMLTVGLGPLVDPAVRFEVLERGSPMQRLLSVTPVRLGEWLLPVPLGPVRRHVPAVDSAPVDPNVRPNILLISIDALRADRFTSEYMPHLVDAAGAGTVFERARTPYPETHRALRAAFTGELRGEMGRDQVSESPTMWDVLRQCGYRSVFVGRMTGEPYVDGEVDRAVRSGIGTAAAVRKRLVNEIESLGAHTEPFAAWVHFFDPHSPYNSRTPAAEPTDVARYDACITDVDEEIPAVLRAVEQASAGRPTLLIVFADHGEEFGEHGGRYHRTTAYEEQVRVPLALAGPGILQGRSRLAVSLVDLGPTIVDLVGRPGTLSSYGRSLTEELKGRPMPEAAMWMEARPDRHSAAVARIAVVFEPWKVISNRVSGTVEVYFLEDDPNEIASRVGDLDRVPREARRLLGYD